MNRETKKGIEEIRGSDFLYSPNLSSSAWDRIVVLIMSACVFKFLQVYTTMNDWEIGGIVFVFLVIVMGTVTYLHYRIHSLEKQTYRILRYFNWDEPLK